MWRTLSRTVGILGLLCWGGMAAAQQVKGGVVSGTIFNHSVDVPVGSAAAVFTVPAPSIPAQLFILTQLCVNGPGMQLSGSTLGNIGAGVGDGCTTYTPGVFLPDTEVLTCTDTFAGGGVGGQSCTLTGVVSKK